MTTITKMNPDVKTKWLEALRSGRYRQTQGTLHKYRGGYCCLGVLCEVAIENGIEVIKEKEPTWHEWSYGGHQTVHPDEVAEWAGIPNTYDGKVQEALVGMNDGIGYEPHNFKQIADWIDENL